MKVSRVMNSSDQFQPARKVAHGVRIDRQELK